MQEHTDTLYLGAFCYWILYQEVAELNSWKDTWRLVQKKDLEQAFNIHECKITFVLITLLPFSFFHLFYFSSFFPPPALLLRNKLIFCMFSPIQGLRFGPDRTHRPANGTRQACRSFACFRHVMPDMSPENLPQLHIVSPTGKKARYHGCRDSGVSKGHLLRLWLKPFRIQIFLDFSSYATPVTLPPPVPHS